jgi:hypothetical protein
MPWQIRRLLAPDAPAFLRIRLEALAKYPQAFGSTYELEAAKPQQYFVGLCGLESFSGEAALQESLGRKP